MNKANSSGLILAVAAAGWFFLISPLTALGAENSCANLKSRVDNIKKVQQNLPADYMSAVQLELSARKTALLAVLACAREEAAQVKTSVVNSKTEGEELSRLKEDYLRRLDQIVEYYQIKETLAAQVGIRGSQEMARDVREWRLTNYIPVVEQILNFTLLNSNRPLITSVENRLKDAESTFKTLGLVDQTDIKDNLAAAKDSLKKSQDGMNTASQMVLKQDSATDTVIVIRQSLEDLAAAYNSLKKLSGILQESIGKSR